MKILIFSYTFSPDVGGIESISAMLANYFSEKGHSVHLITASKNTNKANFSFTILNNPSFFKTVSELKWADVVFENNPGFSLSYPNFFMRKPTVICLQTWLTEVNGKVGLRQTVKKALLKFADKVVACSQAVKESFGDAIVIPNPYNDKLFKRIPGANKTNDFIFLGRLVSDKGADIAIKAFSEVLKTHSSVSLTIAGDGKEMPALKMLVQQLNLQHKINFKGVLEGEALVRCLNEHKYLLVPSVWKEPFGIVALEGIACGCIPIVSDGGGLPEAAGCSGMVFSRGKVDELVKCMLHVLENSQPVTEVSPASMQHLKMHSVPVIAEQYLDVFKRLIN